MFQPFNDETYSVLRDIRRCYEAAESYGIPASDARTSVDITLSKMPLSPFAVGAIAQHFGDLDANLRGLDVASRNERLQGLFGADGVRSAVAICHAFALTPQEVTA